ncbi:MAG: GAF domain-containing protein [Pseudanabaenaceae cyanobacterium bins.68]|nr:GAF domain-containing protein [Pseudanabaenaceae cyanobacterium bins.68]
MLNSDIPINQAGAETLLQQFGQITNLLKYSLDFKELLWQLLKKGCELTWSDAGTIYLVDKESPRPLLSFAVSYNASQPDRSLEAFALPMDNSNLVGYVALSATTLALEDVYQIPATAPYRHHPTFDAEIGYRTRSALVLPMLNFRAEVIGVVQLLNRKLSPDLTVLPENVAQVTTTYSDCEVTFATILANLLAIAIERGQILAQL